LKRFFFCLLFLLYPALSFAVETGDAYWSTFGGYQEGVFTDEDRTSYLGLTTTLFQPTLNWGDHHFNFIGFYRDNDTDQFELGYLSYGMKDLWIAPGYEMDSYLGDGDMQFITPLLIFEHLGLPSQSMRGISTDLRTKWGRAGVQAGKFTEGDFFIPGAVDTVDGELVGTYLELLGPGKSRFAGALDFVSEDDEDRLLATFYGSLPFPFAEIRGASWYDSASEQLAGVGGIRKSNERKYVEAGFLHVPEDFEYLNKTNSLPRGESLLFGTYRFSGVRHGYYMEGSGGKLDASDQDSWLYRGSLGGYYRASLRDTLSSSLNFSHKDTDSGGNQTRLHENFRYSRRRSKWDNSLQLQAIQLFEDPPDENSSGSNDSYRWLGEVSSSYLAGSWDAGGKISLEHETVDARGDKTSALFRLEGRTITRMGLTGGGFLQYGVGWNENDRSEVCGGGINITCPLPGGWQLRTRLRAQRSSLSIESGALSGNDSDTTHTTIDLFAIIERRHYWGEPSPVIGKFTGNKPRGVGHLRGRVYVDMNGNGIFDTGDKPLGGVVLRLDEGFVVETDSSGRYHFPNVSAGQHLLNLDPASFPIEYLSPTPEGVSFQVHPRDETKKDWPLQILQTYAKSPASVR
jgi:hypothetical protein